MVQVSTRYLHRGGRRPCCRHICRPENENGPTALLPFIRMLPILNHDSSVVTHSIPSLTSRTRDVRMPRDNSTPSDTTAAPTSPVFKSSPSVASKPAPRESSAARHTKHMRNSSGDMSVAKRRAQTVTANDSSLSKLDFKALAAMTKPSSPRPTMAHPTTFISTQLPVNPPVTHLPTTAATVNKRPTPRAYSAHA